MYDYFFEACSSVSMSMLKANTLQKRVQGHINEYANPEASRDECRTWYKEKYIPSKDK